MKTKCHMIKQVVDRILNAKYSHERPTPLNISIHVTDLIQKDCTKL